MFRSVMAIAALVLSASAVAERYLVIDLRSMDYFWMEFSGSQEKRFGYVTFNRTADDKYTYGSAYAARRYVGPGPFEGYMSIKTFTVKRRDDESILMQGSLQKEKTTRGTTDGLRSFTYETTVIRGAFYDSQGNEDGEFIATQDYSNKADLHYVCGSGRYRCVDWRSLYRGSQECRGKDFPGKFAHLSQKGCEDELKVWKVEKKIREEEWKCSSENKSATFRSKLKAGCLEPSYSFKTSQKDPLMYNKCLVNWVGTSRITIFPRGHRETTRSIYPLPSSMFSVFKDRTEYEFSSTAKDDTLELYFNEDVPEDLKYLVNEAAYSCAVDPFSEPPEEFWPVPWAKPTWEAMQ